MAIATQLRQTFKHTERTSVLSYMATTTQKREDVANSSSKAGILLKGYAAKHILTFVRPSYQDL